MKNKPLSRNNNTSGTLYEQGKVILKKLYNPPSKSFIDYRIADYASFKAIMLQDILRKESLKGWTISPDKRDYGITLIEMWAYLCDILTYYQERIASEAFVKTATQNESVVALFNLANFSPLLGRSASTLLRFIANDKITSHLLSKGFKVRSIPLKGEDSVIFETNEDIRIFSDHNLMRLDGWREGFRLDKGTTHLRLSGVYPELKEGDFLLITEGNHSEAIKIAKKIDKDGKTEIYWSEDQRLHSAYNLSTTRILRFTQVARPFGYDAPPPTAANLYGTLSRISIGISGEQSESERVKDMLVQLTDTSGNIIMQGNSDQNGEFSFMGIFPGTYRIRVPRVAALKKANQMNIVSAIQTKDFQVLSGYEFRFDAVQEVFSVTQDLLKADVQKMESETLDFVGKTLEEYLPDFATRWTGIKEALQQNLPGLAAITTEAINEKLSDFLGDLPIDKLGLIQKRLLDYAPDLRFTLTLNFKEMSQYDITAHDSLTSEIYLDRTYKNLQTRSYVLLISDPTDELVNSERQLFRIQRLNQEFRIKYGMSGNATKISLQGSDGRQLDSKQSLPGEPYRIRNTLILTNPVEELLPDPEFASKERTESRDSLVLEGSYPFLRPGMFLGVTDKTSTLKGILLNSELKPLQGISARIYRTEQGDTAPLLSSSSFSNKVEIGVTSTDNNGFFIFEDLGSGTYSISLFISNPLYWENFVENLIDAPQWMIDKIRKICGETSSLIYNRTQVTALQISIALIEEMKARWAHYRNTISFLEMRVISILDEIVDVGAEISSLLSRSDLWEASTRLDISENEEKSLYDRMTSDVFLDISGRFDRFESLTNTLQGISSTKRTDEYSSMLMEIAHDTLLTATLIQEAVRLVKDTLLTPVESAERIECNLGYAKPIQIDANVTSTLTMISNSQDRLTFVVARMGTPKVEVTRVVGIGFENGKTNVTLEPPLSHSYVKGFAEVFGNLVPASHGETIADEILGSSNASIPHQNFALKRNPLSYISSPLTMDGIKSTLRVFVNGVEWTERRDFLDSKAEDRHFTTRLAEDGSIKVIFGDGKRGAIPPTGVDNVRAQYRIGIGSKGNLPYDTRVAAQESDPTVKSISIPLGSFGGFEKQPLEQRNNLDAHISSLDRAVSLEDYARLALNFGDIEKTKAFEATDNGRRQVRLVVAGSAGKEINSVTMIGLKKFLDMRRDPNIPLAIESFVPVPVDIIVNVEVEDNYPKSKVITEIERKLSSGRDEDKGYGLFAFEELDFGENVALSDVYGIIEKIEGVKYTVVKKFTRRDSGTIIQDVIRSRNNEILLCENDPLDPAKGTIKVIAGGGIEP